jgi:TorA maturation chaperone TorD
MAEAGAKQAADTALLDPEELARANLYGLVSRLFYAPADPKLLAEICRSETQAEEGSAEGQLNAAWRALQDACRSAYPAVVRQEYDDLLVGVGKAQVTPYLSAYAEPNAPDRYLVRLREQLAAWGLGRRETTFEVEDHVSGLSDTMRWLIEAHHPIAEQRRFFQDFVYPGMVPFLAAVQSAASASFYKTVASFVGAFVELEQTAFGMDEES